MALWRTVRSMARGGLVLAVACCGCASGDGRVAPGVRVEFHAADTVPFPGAVEMPDARAGSTVYVHPDVRLDETDIVSVRHLSEGVNDIVTIRLSPAGGAKMRQLSRERSDKCIVILVNGRVVAVAGLHGEIEDRVTLGGLTEDRAIELERMITLGGT